VLWWSLLSKKLISRVKVSQLGIYRCVSGPIKWELASWALSFISFTCWFFFKLVILRLTRWDSGLVKVTTRPWSRLMFIVAPAFFKMVVQQRALAQVRPRVGAQGLATLRIDFRMIDVAWLCDLCTHWCFFRVGASFISEKY